MEISAAMVKELRDETNVGMMECKKALIEAGGIRRRPSSFSANADSPSPARRRRVPPRKATLRPRFSTAARPG